MSDALCLVTSDESNKTWGRNTICRQEEFEDIKRNFKKKGCTWGPNSIQMKERTDGRERYTCDIWWCLSVHCGTEQCFSVYLFFSRAFYMLHWPDLAFKKQLE